MLSSTLQERDTNSAKQFTVGQNVVRHHDISQVVDFIEDSIFNAGGFHVSQPLVLEFARKLEYFGETKKTTLWPRCSRVHWEPSSTIPAEC